MAFVGLCLCCISITSRMHRIVYGVIALGQRSACLFHGGVATGGLGIVNIVYEDRTVSMPWGCRARIGGDANNILGFCDKARHHYNNCR